MGAHPGEGTPPCLRVIWLRVRTASADQWSGVPAVRFRPLGELARRCHAGGRQDGGVDPPDPQAQEPEGRDARPRRLPRQALESVLRKLGQAGSKAACITRLQDCVSMLIPYQGRAFALADPVSLDSLDPD